MSVKLCSCDWVHLCDECICYAKICVVDYNKRQIADANYTTYTPRIESISHQKFLELTETWSGNFFHQFPYPVIAEEDRIKMRDKMRQEQCLWVDGYKMPVVLETKPKCCSHEPDAECLCDCHKIKAPEVIGFSRLLSAKEMAEVTDYLKAKYLEAEAWASNAQWVD